MGPIGLHKDGEGINEQLNDKMREPEFAKDRIYSYTVCYPLPEHPYPRRFFDLDVEIEERRWNFLMRQLKANNEPYCINLSRYRSAGEMPDEAGWLTRLFD